MTIQDLHARIAELGGQTAYPVVPLDLYFEGNEDPASFAPNLDPHPGIRRIYAVLAGMAKRTDVSSDAAEVHRSAGSIEPDEPSPDSEENYGWLGYADRDRATPPPGAPEVPERYRPVTLFWD